MAMTYASEPAPREQLAGGDGEVAQGRKRDALQGLEGQGYAVQRKALNAVQHKKPPAKKPRYQDPSAMGIFLVGWTPAQVANLQKEFAAYAGLKVAWDPATFELTYVGVDAARKAARVAEGRWSAGMHKAWVDALVSAPRHSVVIGAQTGDFDDVRGGYASSKAMVLDMVDLASFKGDTQRVQASFNTYWVLTHELLGHFYLKTDHGRAHGYKSYDIKSYKYEHDETLQIMNRWRIEMGLPVRLQHPPRVEGQKRSYIFVDAYPNQPSIDINAKTPDPNVKLPPVAERKKKFDALRAKVQNHLKVPAGLDVKYYPEASFIDDDSDASGKNLPGRGSVLPLLFWGCSHKDETKLCQTKLNERGHGLKVDGIFGKNTNRAVRSFQGSKPDPIKVDGLVGKNTWSKLLGYRVATQKDLDDRAAGLR